MDSRMNKYNTEKPVLKKRTDKNKDLYKNINEGFIASDFDINSNMTVLNTDSRVIDVDKIRDMLDRKYRVEEQNKKHIIIPEEKEETIELVNTKEYDINSILEKAKKSKNFDYAEERLKSIHNTQYDILKKLDIKENEEQVSDDEENLVNLINTITALELKNKNNKKKHEEALEMFPEFMDEDDAEGAESESNDEYATSNNILNFKSEDYEGFEDLKNDIKANSILIKIVGMLFILILLIGVLIFLNNYLDLGLF